MDIIMKLSRHINSQFLISSSVAFVLGALLGFQLLSNILYEEAKEKLVENSYWVEQNIIKEPNWSGMPPFIHIEKIALVTKTSLQLLDTLLINPLEEGEMEPFFVLKKSVNIAGQGYQITILQTMLEYEDLLLVIISVFLSLFILLLAIIFGLNHLLFQRIWKPFHFNLAQLKQFSIQSTNTLNLESSNIQEFTQLNEAIQVLTTRIQQDYANMKAFTENASHELQTPLAIMRSKVEVLLQDAQLSKEQGQKLAIIYTQISRLSKLNASLLLLAKIENGQFNTEDSVDAKAIWSENWALFEELAAAKSLRLSQTIADDCLLHCNKDLLYIAFKNLLENAIKYTPVSGQIIVQISKKSMSISNSGTQALPKPKQLYQRFTSGQTENATGLGLAIVKQIADYARWTIQYRFENNLHIFEILFQKN